MGGVLWALIALAVMTFLFGGEAAEDSPLGCLGAIIVQTLALMMGGLLVLFLLVCLRGC